jgi:hypothetical protein
MPIPTISTQYENSSTWKIVKKPKPMQTKPMTGANQNMLADEVHPNMKSPPAKKTDPTIIGGGRASGTALLPLATNLLV